MPEIAEIARIVHFLNKHVVSRTIRAVKAQEDTIVFGKVGTSAEEFQKAVLNKRVVAAKQQGKYFWMEMESPPHVLMHFGMTGWIHLSNEHTYYYQDKKKEESIWPPKFWKFVLEMSGEPKCEVAFCDARRLGRIRLMDCPGADMRKMTPLKENGPDPVIDSDVLTVDWLANKMRSKRVPVKAFLLDQANISGVGNWVGDDVLYQAKIHPEQYTNTFNDQQVKALHGSLMNVCNTAVSLLGDSEKLPDNWLMRHRWGKDKSSGKLPDGSKIIWLTVGGRSSAVVPSVQKKTGPVAGDGVVKSESEDSTKTKVKTAKKRSQKPQVSEEVREEAPSTKKQKVAPLVEKVKKVTEKTKKVKMETPAPTVSTVDDGRRRSTRSITKRSAP